MYCTQCGTLTGDGAKFCTNCGKPVGGLAMNPPVAYAAPHYRRLRRIMSQKKIAGVCAGFAEYFDMDLTLMRIIWLLLLLTSGVGGVGYIIAMIVMPKEEV